MFQGPKINTRYCLYIYIRPHLKRLDEKYPQNVDTALKYLINFFVINVIPQGLPKNPPGKYGVLKMILFVCL
jgi:hypothetical protein